ncbi:hypothetical protein F5Y01DRAFT_309298 [Xylaria sp. FL0043]|nr:hypothetical protein F5Y01DRAFT_309298 [Xylaria sp. FL0043]
MPPKRKQRGDDTAFDSESEIVVVHDDPALLLQKVEKFKRERDEGRKKITASFNKYLEEKKEEIVNRYTSKAQKRSTEAKALLSSFARALEQRASIERSIAKLVAQSQEDTEDLVIVLEAVQVGRRRKLEESRGSFASLVPKSTTSAPTMTPPSSVLDKRAFEVLGEALGNGREEGHAEENIHNGDAKHRHEERGKRNAFDEFLW